MTSSTATMTGGGEIVSVHLCIASQLEHVFLCLRSFCSAFSWSGTLCEPDCIAANLAAYASFRSGTATIFEIVLSALETATQILGPNAVGVMHSTTLQFVMLMTHLVVKLPEDFDNVHATLETSEAPREATSDLSDQIAEATKWCVQTLTSMFTVRSAGGKSLADFLLAIVNNASIHPAAGSLRELLLAFEQTIEPEDPFADRCSGLRSGRSWTTRVGAGCSAATRRAASRGTAP
eukprot:TRINITY_DN4901_c0_g1_i1.p1 TRINITY_DN4901_c0_g1~~TRINITY_DN4901_c0_g1_i1.p1  ORF type:complete len:235 (+),score=1.17 TRINITY_DN4901_c0_g1_i1:212-916(+)